MLQKWLQPNLTAMYCPTNNLEWHTLFQELQEIGGGYIKKTKRGGNRLLYNMILFSSHTLALDILPNVSLSPPRQNQLLYLLQSLKDPLHLNFSKGVTKVYESKIWGKKGILPRLKYGNSNNSQIENNIFL